MLNSFDIKDDDILPILKNLNVDEDHGWDQSSIRMIKTCGDSINFLLKLIFKSMINEGVIPEEWKKINPVPIYKKESKNPIENDRPTLFLPTFRKFLRDKFLTRCLTSFFKINYSPPVRLALYQLTPVFHNYYQSHMKFIRELGLESLTDRRWTSKLTFFIKDYLTVCDNLRTYLVRSSTQKTIKAFPARTKTFVSSFFPCCARAWQNLSEELRNIDSMNTFKSSILVVVKSIESLVFPVHNINGVKLV